MRHWHPGVANRGEGEGCKAARLPSRKLEGSGPSQGDGEEGRSRYLGREGTAVKLHLVLKIIAVTVTPRQERPTKAESRLDRQALELR